MDKHMCRIVERASTRGYWEVEPSAQSNGRYQVLRSVARDVLADGLSQRDADRLAATYNAARDDAAALSEQFGTGSEIALHMF